jgi:hypothetical protein
VSSKNVLVAINCEPAAVAILRNRRARSPTSWIPHWPIPVQLGCRRVGSVEGGNAVGCQRPQDRDLGGRCLLRRRAAPRGHGKHAGNPVADSLMLFSSDGSPSR